jgi:hypothetical protein
MTSVPDQDLNDVTLLEVSRATHLDYNCPYQPYLITQRWYICVRLFWIKMRRLAVARNEHLRRQVDYMCKTAAFCKISKKPWSVSMWTNALDFSLLPVIRLASSGLKTCGKFLHHC